MLNMVKANKSERFILSKDSLLKRISCIHGVKYYQTVIPASDVWRIMYAYYHKTGYYGVSKTYHRITTKYYWPRMKSQIYTFIKSCDECQRSKPNRQSNFGFFFHF